MKNKSIGTRLISIRETEKLTQKQMALKMKVSLRVYQRYENEEQVPGGDKLANLLSDLKVIDASWLMTGESKNIDESKEVCGTIEGEKTEFKISDALAMTARVLESGTSYATALYLNIQHFDRAIQAETRITVMEQALKSLQEQISDMDTKLTGLLNENTEMKRMVARKDLETKENCA